MLEDKEIGYIMHKATMMSKNSFTNKLNLFGITPGQFTVLKEILNHKEDITGMGLSPACIADRLVCDRPSISGIVDRLEAQEWIARVQNPDDKRSFIINVTDKAKDSMKELEHIHKDHQDTILNGFSDEEAIMFKKFLLMVIDNFKGMES